MNKSSKTVQNVKSNHLLIIFYFLYLKNYFLFKFIKTIYKNNNVLNIVDQYNQMIS